MNHNSTVIWISLKTSLTFYSVKVDCNVTTWTEWTACCNKERKKTKTTIRGNQCKAVSEVEGCTEDNCPGHNSEINN